VFHINLYILKEKNKRFLNFISMEDLDHNGEEAEEAKEGGGGGGGGT